VVSPSSPSSRPPRWTTKNPAYLQVTAFPVRRKAPPALLTSLRRVQLERKEEVSISLLGRGRDREIESPLYIYKYKNRSNRSIYLSLSPKSLRINSFRK